MSKPRRMMIFIDGENLVCRYQSMLKKGLIPQPGLCHESDIYVWSINGLRVPSGHEIIRAYYYTSLVGDDVRVSNVYSALKKLAVSSSVQDSTVLYSESKQNLYPVIFKKPGNSKKTKVVDIQMTVDILTHVYQDNLDTVCLFSGDGDYKAVIEEVIRKGKQVYIGAFSDGFSPTLRKLADVEIDLDATFIDYNNSPSIS